MERLLLFAAIVIILCILMNRAAARLPIPSLLVFMGLGIVFGVDGVLGIPFDDYGLSETICSVSLIFIMFYGGFGTNINAARPVMIQSFLLSTIGVVVTAFLTGTAAHYLLGLSWKEGVLVGSVLASTDAASVFNVLRSKKLSLKNHTDSMLELESGSNDPVSYMLTIVMIALLSGSEISVPALLLQQIFFGITCGLLIGKAAVYVINKVDFRMKQGRTVFVFAVVVAGYALPSVLGGNGYLGVYLCGICMGNSFMPDKKDMVRFFDIITEMAQMIIFFLLGLLVTPSQLFQVFFPALVLYLFMTFIGRPAAVFLILKPMKASLRQIGLVSWAGLRGVASIVFSIYVVLGQVEMTYNLFNLVFVIVLLSLAGQGTLLPAVARKLDMIDSGTDVLKTFNDYQEANDVSFIKIKVVKEHPYTGRYLKDIVMPPGFLAVLVFRGKESLMPNGDTLIREGDLLVCAAPAFEDRDNLLLHEVSIGENHKWLGRRIKDLNLKMGLIIMIKRNGGILVPNGDTQICHNDVLILRK